VVRDGRYRRWRSSSPSARADAEPGRAAVPGRQGRDGDRPSASPSRNSRASSAPASSSVGALGRDGHPRRPPQPGDDADLRHGDVIIEINRVPSPHRGDYLQVAAARVPAMRSRSTSTSPAAASGRFTPCAPSANPDKARQPTMKVRILVIDDEAAIRDSMRMILEYEGYEFSARPRRGRHRDRRAEMRTISCSSTSRCPAWTASMCSASSASRPTPSRS